MSFRQPHLCNPKYQINNCNKRILTIELYYHKNFSETWNNNPFLAITRLLQEGKERKGSRQLEICVIKSFMRVV